MESAESVLNTLAKFVQDVCVAKIRQHHLLPPELADKFEVHLTQGKSPYFVFKCNSAPSEPVHVVMVCDDDYISNLFTIKAADEWKRIYTNIAQVTRRLYRRNIPAFDDETFQLHQNTLEKRKLIKKRFNRNVSEVLQLADISRLKITRENIISVYDEKTGLERKYTTKERISSVDLPFHIHVEITNLLNELDAQRFGTLDAEHLWNAQLTETLEEG